VLAMLSEWLAGEGLDAWDLTLAVVAGFVAGLRGSGYRNPRSWRGFGTVLGYLRRVGAVPVLPPPTRPPLTGEQELLDRYRRYLTSLGTCKRSDGPCCRSRYQAALSGGDEASVAARPLRERPPVGSWRVTTTTPLSLA
jgi:hypothetical protein